jgi:hypothetical protein
MMLLAPTVCFAADTAPEALLKRLSSLAGAGARDCGVVAQGSNREAAIACAREASSSGNAYRLAVQLEGADSSIWQGAVRDEQGKFRVVFYEADSGGSGTGPTMSVLLCREILFAVKGSDAIECQPIRAIRRTRSLAGVRLDHATRPALTR